MLTRVLALVVAAGLALSPLTGCTPGSALLPTLSGARLVVAASVQASDLDAAVVKGAILIRGAQATIRVPTEGMDSAKLVRLGDRIAFSDQRNDYLLGSSLQTFPRSTEENFQVGAVASDEVTAVFNQGVEEESYLTDVVRYGRSPSVAHAQRGAIPFGLADCGGAGPVVIGSPGDGTPNAVAIQVVGGKELPVPLPFQPSAASDRAACADGHVLTVLYDEEVEDGGGYLLSVRTSDGSHILRKLVDAKGQRLHIADDDLDEAAIRPDLADGGTLEWIGSSSGAVYRTVVATGRTSVAATGLPDADSDRLVRFRADGCDILSSRKGDWTLHRYDRAWALTATPESLPWLGRELGNGLWAYDFLVLA